MRTQSVRTGMSQLAMTIMGYGTFVSKQKEGISRAWNDFCASSNRQLLVASADDLVPAGIIMLLYLNFLFYSVFLSSLGY
jgi:hypothetical protein